MTVFVNRDGKVLDVLNTYPNAPGDVVVLPDEKNRPHRYVIADVFQTQCWKAVVELEGTDVMPGQE